uniref:Uncharacterized protein n=1 Tax=Anguilla anguilla TaxID=7936 RepID=A0A0E9XX58_ANGAN
MCLITSDIPGFHSCNTACSFPVHNALLLFLHSFFCFISCT